MGRDEDTPSHDVEFLGADPTSRDADDVLPEPTHRWPRWLPFLLAAVVIGLIVHVNRKPSASPPTHPPTTTQPSVSAPGTRPTASSPPASAPPITATQLGAPLLGVSAGWELFGRGDGVVVRIQLARGRITRTTVPALQSSGPVSFLVGPNLAIVRPIDYVPGYVVPDGKPAQQISASLSQGQSGPVFPGPDPNPIWVPNLGGATAMTLSNLDSADYAGTTISIPTGSSPLEAIPDGAGYLLFPSIGGVYDARPDRLRRITTGALLAVGPTGWLTVECDTRAHCVTVLINRATNARRLVGPAVTGSGSQHGVISPDGTKAALVVQSHHPRSRSSISPPALRMRPRCASTCPPSPKSHWSGHPTAAGCSPPGRKTVTSTRSTRTPTRSRTSPTSRATRCPTSARSPSEEFPRTNQRSAVSVRLGDNMNASSASATQLGRPCHPIRLRYATPAERQHSSSTGDRQ